MRIKMEVKHKYQIVILKLVIFLIFSVTPVAGYELVDISSSINPVGSGARAIGMGGAFIAIADDATAASWNPAGLIQLERPEISIVGSFIDIDEDYRSSGGNISQTSLDDPISLNYASFAYPSKSVVFSLNFQHLYNFEKKLKSSNTVTMTTLSMLEITSQIEEDYQQSGAIYALSPSAAFQISNNLSIGLTVNIWRDDLLWKNQWKRKMQRNTVTTTMRNGTVIDKIHRSTTASEIYKEMKGVNLNAGLLWGISPKINVGLVFKSRFKAKFIRKRFFNVVTDAPFNPERIEEDEKEVDITYPESFGIGLSYRHSDVFSAAFDVYRTEWSKYAINEDGVETSLVTMKVVSETSVKPTHQVRIGGEYLVAGPTYAIPFRFGAFLDPEPSEEGVKNFWGATVGSGITFFEKYSFDLAYEFRRANDVKETVSGVEEIRSDILQHRLLLSAIIYF